MTPIIAALICFLNVTEQREVYQATLTDAGVSLGCGADSLGYDYPGCVDSNVSGWCNPFDDYRSRGCVCVEPTGVRIDPVMPCVDSDAAITPFGLPAGNVQWLILNPAIGQSPVCCGVPGGCS